MNEKEINTVAREFAIDATKMDAGDPNLSASDLECVRETITDCAADVLQWLSERYCIVDKNKLDKLNIVYRTKHYDMVVLNPKEVQDLFPELFNQEEEL